MYPSTNSVSVSKRTVPIVLVPKPYELIVCLWIALAIEGVADAMGLEVAGEPVSAFVAGRFGVIQTTESQPGLTCRMTRPLAAACPKKTPRPLRRNTFACGVYVAPCEFG